LGRADRRHYRDSLARTLQSARLRERLSGQQSGLPTRAAAASPELQWWYQVYFSTERGRAGYDKYPDDFSKLIWKLASLKWNFNEATFDRTAASFENADHVAIAIHDYRFRLGLAEGEAKYAARYISWLCTDAARCSLS
jgi:hypothetical protein